MKDLPGRVPEEQGLDVTLFAGERAGGQCILSLHSCQLIGYSQESATHKSQPQLLHSPHCWLKPKALPCAPTCTAVARLSCMADRGRISHSSFSPTWEVPSGARSSCSFLLAGNQPHAPFPKHTTHSSHHPRSTTTAAEQAKGRLSHSDPSKSSAAWFTKGHLRQASSLGRQIGHGWAALCMIPQKHPCRAHRGPLLTEANHCQQRGIKVALAQSSPTAIGALTQRSRHR